LQNIQEQKEKRTGWRCWKLGTTICKPPKKRKLIKKQDQRQKTRKKETAQKKQKGNKTKLKRKASYCIYNKHKFIDFKLFLDKILVVG